MEMKNRFKQVALFVSVAVLGMGSALAAPVVSTQSMNIQWAGTVPNSPISTGAWKFVELNDPTKDFVPRVGTIIVQDDSLVPGGKTLETSLIQFALQTGTDYFSDNTPVSAYLAADVAFSGLTNVQAQPAMTISAGTGKDLKVGSANAVELQKITGATTNNIPVVLRGKGTLPPSSFNEGDNFTAQATIMFTASVGV
ncbi:hypothetical protein [Aeromonas sp. MdU4]|uniref:hypothetical protein n=1 Tax=Aeromonas sp. MdU4 TaxID=3342819 RepID=UPI0035B7C2E6